MKSRKIKDGVRWLGAVDWDRRLFDALIPLPDGTSYNAYLVEGGDKTALLDAVDPPMWELLASQLDEVEKVDYLVSHHTEQDHSGAIPLVLERFPSARLVCSKKARSMLVDHLGVPEDRFHVVEDGDVLDLGGKTLRFLYTPWVHWPETMSTYLEEDKILFSCDFFGSHIATSDLFVTDEGRVYEAAKRYFAEIMMPFRKIIEKNLEKLKPYDIAMIAPSHGPVYDKPQFIFDAYCEWVSGEPKNLVALPFVSMHGSTQRMVDYLVSALSERGVGVQRYNMADSDLGKLAITLVDAKTLVVGTPTVLTGPHPAAAYATILANALRPKVRFLSIIGSYGWGGKTVETLSGMIPNLKVEVLDPVLVKGHPREADFKALDGLAEAIRERHGV
ncbi:MAG: FprA family A-type flavoprotein [Planctomycetota bacterium]|jgi:flavorubredoxin